MKRDSIWIANFASYEDVQDYKRLMENEYGDKECQMKIDFKICEYDDEIIFETFLNKHTNKLDTLIKGNPGDYQYMEQMQEIELEGQYNTLIIYSGYDYIKEREETGLKFVEKIKNANYEIDFIGVFDFNFTRARTEYPKTLSKYGDEQYCKNN